MPGTVNPWDRRDGESDPAWEAFVTYRDMGLERSTAKVAKQLGKSNTIIERWSSGARGHSWVLRVRAYDRHLDRSHQSSLKARRRLSETRQLDASAQLMDKALEALAIMPAEAMKPADIARAIEVAAKIQTTILGSASVQVEHSGPGGEPIQVAATDEERHARMIVLSRELASRIKAHEGDEGALDGSTGSEPSGA